MIPIVEAYESCQMEGPLLGVPSLFLRVGGCNLRCQFKVDACDTPYAVHPIPYLKENKPHLVSGYKEWSLKTNYQTIELIRTFSSKNIVLTGGEPMLYQNALIEIILGFPTRHFEIETNGTISIDEIMRSLPNVSFNISPKLKSSNQEPGYENKREIKILFYPKERSILKFVVSDTNDIPEILEISRKFPTLPVYLMPEGCTRGQVLKNSPLVVNLCRQYGFRFTPREHINIWDAKKGV